MRVYIFRHGHAENKASAPDRTDEGRRLVAEGREQVKWTCERAKEFGAVPGVIMSSPRARGRETAEMTKQLMNPKAALITDECLEPEAKVAGTYKALSRFKKADDVILVTHLPHLGHLFADMLNWDSVWKNLDFENGAMARVDFKGLPKPKSGNLVWMISPTRSA
ncbi:MAG: histidine phosphatase family protein [Nitrososphaerota archaeon]|nr:histidine phosphatase family protein [Nitrososphaerota archaeon]